MNILVINALLDSFMKVLSTMANMELKTGLSTGKIKEKKDNLAKGIVSGIMPLVSDEITGSMAISFSEPVIFDLVKRMVGDDLNEIDETALDLTGEITNMIVGGAKRVLSESENDLEIDMATPKVLSGEGHLIEHASQGKTIIIPFKLESGRVFLEVNFEKDDL